MTGKTLEERVQLLEDIHEIKELRNSYSYNSNVYVGCEFGFRQFADNFVEDGVFDPGFGPDFGIMTGPDEIYEKFQAMPAFFACMMHITTNGSIDVNGDTATGKWTGLYPHIMAGDTQIQWGNAYYYDEYARTSEGWKFKKVTADIFFFTKPWCDFFPALTQGNSQLVVASIEK